MDRTKRGRREDGPNVNGEPVATVEDAPGHRIGRYFSKVVNDASHRLLDTFHKRERHRYNRPRAWVVGKRDPEPTEENTQPNFGISDEDGGALKGGAVVLFPVVGTTGWLPTVAALVEVSVACVVCACCAAHFLVLVLVFLFL